MCKKLSCHSLRNESYTMEQDTGKFRKNEKDQFYTKQSVAQQCVDKVHSLLPETSEYQWIEPSAGNGVFLHVLPIAYDKLGIDIEPKSPEIRQMDFMEWNPSQTGKQKRIIFGNPPFGRQGSLAKSFIKRASCFADVIAFILPRSFVKPSMSNAFPLQFHCIHSEELDKKSFEVNGIEHDVPCVFQIWEKKQTDRSLVEPIKEQGFVYVKCGQPYHIAFKRAGGLAGKCFPFSKTIIYNHNCHYFLKLDDVHISKSQQIIDVTNSHTFPSNTVGPRSLSKSEANEVLNQAIASNSPR